LTPILSDEMLNTTTIISTTIQKIGDPLVFYEVAATIFPILWGALAYEVRVFRIPEIKSPEESSLAQGLAYAVWACFGGCFLAGEAVALTVLATQHPNPGAAEAVAILLWLMGTAIVNAPLVFVLVPDAWLSRASLFISIYVGGGMLAIHLAFMS
jgi:integral membrane sensor domain MASE1